MTGLSPSASVQTRRVAALFVAARGIYCDRVDVDAYDATRDARLYMGPLPVVAHPPCTTWGAFARQGWTSRPLGDDDGCFEAALDSVRRFGGVLEHPAESSAWAAFGLTPPLRRGGWHVADFVGGWCCHIEQGHYGHKAPKPTWLYAVGVELPSLRWGHSDKRRPSRILPDGRKRSGAGFNSLSTKQRAATPPPFAALLLSIARTARASTGGGSQ